MSFNFKRNQTECPIEVSFSDPDGTIKTNVTAATVRVFQIVSGSEVDVLAVQSMAQIGSTNRYRYNWEPASLPEGQYTVEIYATDADTNEFRAVYDLYVNPSSPTDEYISDNVLTKKDGDIIAERYRLYDKNGNPTNTEPLRKVMI